MQKLDIATSWQVNLTTAAVRPTTPVDAKLLWSDEEGFTVSLFETPPIAEYQLRFWDEAVAQIHLQQKCISLAALSSDATAATLEHILCDQIYPRLLAHEGHLVLHAGAVDIDGKLALFLGDSGMGKSTLVASLYRTGALLLNDDTLVVERDDAGFTGRAIYQGLRLLPDSMSSLFPQQTPTRQMAHYSPKQRLDVTVDGAKAENSSARPVGVMFFLAPATQNGLINLRPMSAAETCMGIITNSFSLDPTDPLHARNKLLQASALANGIPAFELSYPRDYALLPQVHQRIREQLAKCASVMPTDTAEVQNQ